MSKGVSFWESLRGKFLESFFFGGKYTHTHEQVGIFFLETQRGL